MADVEILAQEEFVLITTKTLVDQGTEGRPIKRRKLLLDGLQLALGGFCEMHCGHMDPHRSLHSIHFEVIRGTGHPELGIVTIEFWKFELRKATQMSGIELGSGDLC